MFFREHAPIFQTPELIPDFLVTRACEPSPPVRMPGALSSTGVWGGHRISGTGWFGAKQINAGLVVSPQEMLQQGRKESRNLVRLLLI